MAHGIDRLARVIWGTTAIAWFLFCAVADAKDTADYGISREVYEYIKTESVPGGRMDPWPKLDGEFFKVTGVIYNRRDFGLLLWGATVKKLGVRNADEALELYEEIRSEELDDPGRRALRRGFEMERPEEQEGNSADGSP